MVIPQVIREEMKRKNFIENHKTVVPRLKCDMLQGTFLGAQRHITL